MPFKHLAHLILDADTQWPLTPQYAHVLNARALFGDPGSAPRGPLVASHNLRLRAV